jgi:hypothetical protein
VTSLVPLPSPLPALLVLEEHQRGEDSRYSYENYLFSNDVGVSEIE